MDDAYFFKDGKFILSFFSDWAYPFLYYQFYLIDQDLVVYGYLDVNSEFHSYNKSNESFVMYYANLLRIMTQYNSEIECYLNSDIKKTVVTNQNFKHLGHAIWNGISAINPLLDEEALMKDKCISFSPRATVLPSYIQGLSSLSSRIVTQELDEPSVYNDKIFKLTIKANFVYESTANQILRSALSNIKHEALNEIREFRKKHFPIIIIGLRCGTRAWSQQEQGYKEIINKVLSSYPKAGFIIDGMNIIDTEVHSSHANIDLSAEFDIARELLLGNPSVVSLVGSNVDLSIAWGEVADFVLAPWGAGLAKYKWINNIKGLVYSSKCVLEEKNDLHIYDDERYREFAVCDMWLPSSHSTNEGYSSLDAYKLENPTGNGYYYQNFDIDTSVLLKLTLEYLDNIAPFENEFRCNSLKVISNHGHL